MTYKKNSPFHTCLLSYDIVLYSKVQYWIRTLKKAIENLYVIFFNKKFSVDIASISAELLLNLFNYILEGSVSQNLDLGPCYFFFMLCRYFGKQFFQLLFTFNVIKM